MWYDLSMTNNTITSEMIIKVEVALANAQRAARNEGDDALAIAIFHAICRLARARDARRDRRPFAARRLTRAYDNALQIIR